MSIASLNNCGFVINKYAVQAIRQARASQHGSDGYASGISPLSQKRDMPPGTKNRPICVTVAIAQRPPQALLFPARSNSCPKICIATRTKQGG